VWRGPKKFKDQLPVDYGIAECSTTPNSESSQADRPVNKHVIDE